MPAVGFEQALATATADHLEALARRLAVLRNGTVADSAEATRKAQSLAVAIRQKGVAVIAPAITSGEVSAGRLCISFDRVTLAGMLGLDPEDLDPALLDLETPFACRRRGVELKIVAGDRRRSPDPAMLRALRNAHRWADMLKGGLGLKDISVREGMSESYVGRIVPLSTLSPRLQEAIVTGSQPPELTLEILVRSRLPLHWCDQQRCFGLGS